MTSQRVPAVKDKLLIGTGLLVSVVTFVVAARMLVAGVSTYQVDLFVADWESDRSVPGSEEWLLVRNAAERAVQSYPVRSGELMDQLGRVYEWRHLNSGPANPFAIASRQRAREAYLKSVEHRPLSPHTWSRLAYTKLRMMELDEEFDKAVRQARNLGAWRPEINTEIAEIGIAAWPKLTDKQQGLVLRSIEAALRGPDHQAGKLMALMAKSGMENPICNALNASGRAEGTPCYS